MELFKALERAVKGCYVLLKRLLCNSVKDIVKGGGGTDINFLIIQKDDDWTMLGIEKEVGQGNRHTELGWDN